MARRLESARSATREIKRPTNNRNSKDPTPHSGERAVLKRKNKSSPTPTMKSQACEPCYGQEVGECTEGADAVMQSAAALEGACG